MTRAILPQTGRTIEIPAGETLLGAALGQSIDYPHGCRSGRIVFMDQGRIVETGDPDTFFDRPRTDRTRAFLAHLRCPGASAGGGPALASVC